MSVVYRVVHEGMGCITWHKNMNYYYFSFSIGVSSHPPLDRMHLLSGKGTSYSVFKKLNNWVCYVAVRAGKTLVKYDVRRLHEVVVEPMQRMEQENQQMQSLQSEHNTLKKAVSETSRNLQLREEELQVLRDRGEKQHAENKRQV